MTNATHRPILIAGLIMVSLSLTACGSAASSAAPASQPAVAATPSPPTPTASITPTATPSGPTAAVPCELKPQTGMLPSDRLTSMQVLGLPGVDIVRFGFSPGSLTPAGPAVGSLDVATPPFTGGASGLPIDLQGDHALQVVFRGLSLQNDAGQETYSGDREIRATDPSKSLRHVVLFDKSEGQIGWYLGYDEPSCVTFSREGMDILVSITYGPGT